MEEFILNRKQNIDMWSQSGIIVKLAETDEVSLVTRELEGLDALVVFDENYV